MKALFLAFGALCLAEAAQASPCAKQIADLEARHKSGSAPDIGSSGESVDAMLHHQPTASSVGDAGADSVDSKQAERDAHFQIEIEQAKAAENSGDVAGCEAAVAEARKALAR